ncbi:MAG: hypothetical protein HYY17_02910 [Planctomycetes bacterium]|nr:hypothetical protein [Planctomycetota bacterium]
MADLVTHYLTARIPAARLSRPIQAAFVVGALLPDVVGKFLDRALQTSMRFDVPSHTVLGLALYAYAACFLFEERVRRGAWLALWLGGLLHVFVDLLKDTMGSASSAFFLFPFTARSFELGLYEPLHAVWSVPVAVVFAASWEWFARRRGADVWE